MYLIRYTDMQGTEREWLSKRSELRAAVEDFYLDECPAHISSVIEVHSEPTREELMKREVIRVCKEVIP